MKFSKVFSVALQGLDARLVDVEVDTGKACDKLILVIVGLPDTSVKESKDRVLTAIKNSGFHLNNAYCTVNLAPGHLRKEGAVYDLPIAIGLLQSLGLVNTHDHESYLLAGELGLSGKLRPIRGALAIAMLAKELGKRGVLLPAMNTREASAVPSIEVIPIHHLKDAIEFLENPSKVKPLEKDSVSIATTSSHFPIDFSDIKGQAHAKRAAEIAVAGGHNIILSGPPGSGKSMMAKALVGIMPEMTIEECLETTKIHSIAGILPESVNLMTQRPFRSPHHTVSYAGLIGGGVTPRPGEISLAHNGILFLDELPEFSRVVLEVLRQPLEDRKVTISRANGNFTYPTRVLCIAAMNPCPCGLLGHPEKPCKDSQAQIDRYRNKISAPLWDRLDMHIEMPALKYHDMMQSRVEETSCLIRQRVTKARERQHHRFGSIKTNSEMTPNELKRYCALDQESQDILRQALDVMGLSARACDKLLRVALTIADLTEASHITAEHLMEALNFRNPAVSSPSFMI